MKKFQDVIQVIIKYLFLVISVIIVLTGISSIFVTARLDNTFFHQSENTIFEFSFGIIPLLISIAILIFILIFSSDIFKRIKPFIYMILILIFCGILFFGWINALKLYPDADQKMIYDMAESYVKNKDVNIYLLEGQYLFLFPFQFGFVLLVYNIFKLFGTNFIYVEYLNAICTLVNIVLLYKISNKIFGDKNQKVLIILELLFSLYWMFFNVHFYGNIIGLTLALFAVYFVIEFSQKNKTRYLVISGLFMALSVIIKTNYEIFLCGIILFLLIDELFSYKKNDYTDSFKTNQVSDYKLKLKYYYTFKPIIVLATFILVFKLTGLSYDLAVKHIYHVDLPDGIPMLTFVYMGMDEPEDKAPGWYNGVTKKLYEQNGFNKEKTVESTKHLIIERQKYFFQNPRLLVSYFLKKFASTWLNPTFQTIWCSIPGNRYRLDENYAHYLGYHEKLLNMVGGDLCKIEEAFFDGLEIIIFIFAGYSIICAAKKEELTSKDHNHFSPYVILPIIFIGGFVFHLIWETKAIYVIQYYFILLPYTADGISRINIKSLFHQNHH